MISISEPRLIEHDSYIVAGAFCAYAGEDEGPGWSGAYAAFSRRLPEISNRKDHFTLGFLYRPSKDDPAAAEETRACFVGVDVADQASIPQGMAVTRFSGGTYAVIAIQGDTDEEAAEGVGEAIQRMAAWMPAHGFREGDACFACSNETVPRPPYIEYVYMKLERVG